MRARTAALVNSMVAQGNRNLMIEFRVLIIALIACLTTAVPDWAGFTVAGEGPPPFAGKPLYHKGRAPTPTEIMVRLAGSDRQLAGGNFACANCHGAYGTGGQEAGLRAPPIDWNTLSSPRVVPLFGRQRNAYDIAALKRAITQGVDVDGVPLSVGMPRYQMSDGQIDDLIAYLQIIGTRGDSDPGVGQDFVRVGTVLPLTGPMTEIGVTVAATLRTFFDQINAHGGIYQRRILLTIGDSRSDPAGALETTRQLIEGGLFALIASFQPPDSPPLDALISEAEIPSIGPLAQAPRESARSHAYVWYLLPTFADQARVLVDYIVSTGRRQETGSPLRVAIVSADAPDCGDAIRGAKAQLSLHQAAIVSDLVYERGAFAATETARLVMQAGPEWVLFFGPATDLEKFAVSVAANPAGGPAIGALTLLSPVPRQLSSAVSADLVFASPVAWANNVPMVEIVAHAEPSDHISGQSNFQVIAVAAAKTLVEAMLRTGRKLDRVSLTAELERLHGFETKVLPPVNFSPNNHVGSSGAAIFRIDGTQKQYVLVRPWQPPASSR